MKRTRLLLVTAVALGLYASLTPTGAEAGHADDPWYQSRWGSEGDLEDRTPQWRFDNDYPGASYRDRATEAASTWTAIPGYMNFEFAGIPDETTFGWDLGTCGNYQQNIVGVASLEGGDIASARICTFIDTGRMYSFKIAIDSDRIPGDPAVDGSWFTGLAHPWAGNRPDLRGALTHEFGHATGRINRPGTEDGHYEETDLAACPGGPTQPDSEADATMCEFLARNSLKWRTLTSHDISSFEDVTGYN